MIKQVDSFYGMKIGQTVYPTIGGYKGQPVVIEEIEIESGASNGWFTVRMPDGATGMYAGEELE